MIPTTTEWLTANEAAVYLRVKPRTLLAWVRNGKIKAYSLSGMKRRVWRFLVTDLDAALLGNTVVLPSAPGVRAHQEIAQ